MTDQTVAQQARVDPAGRPLEGRRRQALTSFSILVSWICLMTLIFWATRGDGPIVQAQFFWGIAIFAWLAAEAFGGRRALVWPASALAIAGSLSLGFGAGLAMSTIHGPVGLSLPAPPIAFSKAPVKRLVPPGLPKAR